jgi:hypothetical protein
MSKKKDELARLESIIEEGRKKHREAVEALRTIREKDLYKPEYGTFDDYVECRWGRTRQWATQEIAWLRALECLEANGKSSYQFSVGAIQPARSLIEDDPQGFCSVYEEAAQHGLPVTEKSMKEALQHYKTYANLRGKWEEHLDSSEDRAEEEGIELPERPAPLTPQEADSLSPILKDWNRTSWNPNLVEEARARASKEGKDWKEILPELCLEAGKVPAPNDLLEAVRGQALAAVCKSLEEKVLKEWVESDIAKEALKELDKKRAELLAKVRKPKPKPTEAKDSDTPPEVKEDEEDEEKVAITDEEAKEYLAAMKTKMELHGIGGEPLAAIRFVADVAGIQTDDVLQLLLA